MQQRRERLNLVHRRRRSVRGRAAKSWGRRHRIRQGCPSEIAESEVPHRPDNRSIYKGDLGANVAQGSEAGWP
jgi:hypothetical protein